nr:proline-rich receptor-like protein kinase PERK10 [Penaeus vannamei]
MPRKPRGHDNPRGTTQPLAPHATAVSPSPPSHPGTPIHTPAEDRARTRGRRHNHRGSPACLGDPHADPHSTLAPTQDPPISLPGPPPPQPKGPAKVQARPPGCRRRGGTPEPRNLPTEPPRTSRRNSTTEPSNETSNGTLNETLEPPMEHPMKPWN